MNGEKQAGLCVELTQYFSMFSAFLANRLYSWSFSIGSSTFQGPAWVGNKMPFRTSWRKCRDAVAHAVAMVILQHGFNPADQIHHVNEDDFRLSYRDPALVQSVSITCEPH